MSRYLPPAVATFLIVAAPAIAHPKLVSAYPAPNAAVASSASLRLVFSEALVPNFSGADVTRIGGAPARVAGAAVRVGPDRKTLLVTFPKPLPKGTYRIDWHVVSVDTHRVKGGYAFRIG